MKLTNWPAGAGKKPMPDKITIGVLALQGAFLKHIEMLKSLGCNTMEVRTARDIISVDALIIPGGESTTMRKLLDSNNMLSRLMSEINKGMPVFGTCAGMILLAKKISGSEQPHLSVMDIEVKRNAYGRQKESFEAGFAVNRIPGPPFNGIFIRAPRIESVAPAIEVMAEFENVPVLVRQGNLLASSFHPELTNDSRIHEFFISMTADRIRRARETA